MKIAFKAFLIVLCLLWIEIAYFGFKALQAHYEPQQVELISVYDGDTFKVRIEVYPKLYKEVNVRIYGIDTPERNWRADCLQERLLGNKAGEHLSKLLTGHDIIVEPTKDKPSYVGRIIAKVYVNGINVGDEMIKAGHAHAYFAKRGETRGGWCDERS